MPVFTLVTDPVRLTSVLVVGTQRALLVDTGSGPDQAVRILAAVRQLTDLPLVVANTHDHWDHFFGNPTFAEAGVTDFFGSPAFVRDSPGSAWLQYAEASEHALDLPGPAELTVGVRAVEDGERLSLGATADEQDTVEFFIVPGHTDTDLAIRVGDVLMVGDLLEEGAPPQVGIDSTPISWVRSLDRLLALPGVTTFVPGHGRAVDRAFAMAQRTDLAGFASSAGEQLDEDSDDEHEDSDDEQGGDADAGFLPARFMGETAAQPRTSGTSILGAEVTRIA